MSAKPLPYELSIQSVCGLKNFSDCEVAFDTKLKTGRFELCEACFLQVVLNILNVFAINSRQNFLLNIMTDRNDARGFFSKCT